MTKFYMYALGECLRECRSSRRPRAEAEAREVSREMGVEVIVSSDKPARPPLSVLAIPLNPEALCDQLTE